MSSNNALERPRAASKEIRGARRSARIVSAPSEAWRFLQGESPCRVRPNQAMRAEARGKGLAGTSNSGPARQAASAPAEADGAGRHGRRGGRQSRRSLAGAFGNLASFLVSAR